jgi:hypothetical protein
MLSSPPLFLVAAAGLTGCHTVVDVDKNVLHFLQVSVVSGELASEEAPNPFTTDEVTVRLKVESLDRDGTPAPFRGTLGVKTQPGDLISDDEVELVDGVWEGDVSIRYPFGPTRIWFTDEQGFEGNPDDPSDDREPTFVTGVSDALWYELPTIAQVQATDDHEENPLKGEYTTVRTVDRQVIVMAVGLNGMWVTDLADPPGDYNSMFIYTYNKPEYSTPEGDVADEDIVYAEPGQRLASLGGGNQEYLATTQLSFPQYDFYEGEILQIPDPLELEPDDLCSDDIMERLEGALVRAENLTIPDFEYGTDSDFYQYGQWPIEFQSGGCELYAETAAQVPGFYPTDYIGQDVDFIQGLITEVWGKWIILPRDADDISIYTESQTAAKPPARPKARPRP